MTLVPSRPIAAAPAPVVTGASPFTVFQGHASFTLALTGTDFTSNGAAAVYFTPPGGSAVALAILGVPTATLLSATVPAALVASGGTATVVVQSGAVPSAPFSYAIVPQPAIASITPQFSQPGGNSFTLTVNGSGFVPPLSGPYPLPGTLVRMPSAATPFSPLGDPLPTTFVSATQLTALVPGADMPLTRTDLARLAILSQFSEQDITAFLNGTGGMFCSFADVACPGNFGTVTDSTGVAGGWRYIETMYRLGYAVPCSDINDGQRRFCPGLAVDLLGTPGTYGVRASNGVPFELPPLRTSDPVSFQVLPPPVPLGSPLGALAGVAALLLIGCLSLRARAHTPGEALPPGLSSRSAGRRGRAGRSR